MNTEYLWWLLALLLAGGGMVAFLALGHVPEIEDELAGITVPGPTEPAATEDEPAATGPGQPQSSPLSNTVPGPDAPLATSETP